MNTSGDRGLVTVGEVANLVHGEVVGNARTTVAGVSQDSQTVSVGDLFVALPGRNRHGAEFVHSAVAAGAAAVMTDDTGLHICREYCELQNIPLILGRNLRVHLGPVCAFIYPQPSMPLIGITGTNGKTTTAYMVMQGAKSAGLKTGMIGTLATFIGDTELPAIRTTPEAPEIFQLLTRMRAEKVDLVVMEVSSIAISEYRISGLSFDVVGFTNLSHDHLDYHGTMENYFEAKAALFTQEFAKRGVVCINDSWGRALAGRQGIPMQSVCVGTQTDAPIETANWRGITENRDELVIHDPLGRVTRTHVVSPGIMNALNATLAIALLDNVGLSPDVTCAGVGASVVPGRGQLVCLYNNAAVYVDYAHSPDAIESFLSGLRHSEDENVIADNGVTADGRVISVIGAGGDRDSAKRPLMGAAAARYSDIVIVTDDNPRSEDPDTIRASIVMGIPEFLNVQVENIEGRMNGIRRALELALPGDRIAILGKGHEKVIEIDGQTIPFSDSEVVLELAHRV